MLKVKLYIDLCDCSLHNDRGPLYAQDGVDLSHDR
jgi:hypothetical protein